MKLSYPQRNLLRRLLIGGTAVFVSIAAYSSYQAVRNLTLESLKKNALLEVQQGANSIDNWLLNLKVHVQTLANLPVVRSMNWEAAAPYLETEVLRFADVSGIAIAGRDGWRNVTGGKRAYVGDRSFFKKAMAGQTNVSDPLISRVAGLPSIVVGTPIRQEFSIAVAPVGELHTVVKLNRITQVVNQLKYGDNSYAFALNSKGEAIVHPQTLLSTPEQTT
ncbi:cache domain-containing protein, partial [Leptolyngbya sp. FACHB-36]|uniref:cache domain-containing protein n=1 Tax=Leptolyngbya sp. FACHB-36 TaxID=2692808 RepID=UPI001681BEEE